MSVTIPGPKNFNPWKTEMDFLAFEEIKSDFRVSTGMGLQPWAWIFNKRPFVESGKSGFPFIINMVAEYIPEFMDGLSKAGIRSISESIRAIQHALCPLN